ncbi:hypothetical protein FBU31_003009 [Coemansia sp. 'formosensis']|nr:hypothetical protein FBU31_003009 [Coemansia sp. 'formosensis']
MFENIIHLCGKRAQPTTMPVTLSADTTVEKSAMPSTDTADDKVAAPIAIVTSKRRAVNWGIGAGCKRCRVGRVDNATVDEHATTPSAHVIDEQPAALSTGNVDEQPVAPGPSAASAERPAGQGASIIGSDSAIARQGV